MKRLIPVILALFILLSACSPSQTENMSYDLTYQDVAYSGTYTGELQKKLPNGEGTFTFDDGTNVFKYTGQWDQGQMSGNGQLTSSQFLIKFSKVDRRGYFEGDTINGVPNGTGTFTATNESGVEYSYTGDFKDGTFNGQGTRRLKTDPSYSEIGTFVDGAFTPTTKELFSQLSQDPSFSINTLPLAFLDAHADIFTSHAIEGLDSFVDSEFQVSAYTKSPDKYGDKLIKQTSLYIAQIQEFPKYNYDEFTLILAEDPNLNYYFINYIGSVDVYEGDLISAYLLPLDYFTYENVSGGQTWAIACAAAFISK